MLAACSAVLLACGGNGKAVKGECAAESECREAVVPAEVVKLTSEEFAVKVADISSEWKYLGDKPAIVDFYADWCGPCKAIAPHLEEIAKEYDGKLYVYKINVDNDPEIADAFKLVGIPTLLFIPVEGEYSVQIGNTSKEELMKKVAEIMK